MQPNHETAVSEITILPDGRVFVLGASRQVLAILESLNPDDAALKRRLENATCDGVHMVTEVEDRAKISRTSTNSCQKDCQP
jgi:hypothetical protein